jgi:hypothetical protein
MAQFWQEEMMESVLQALLASGALMYRPSPSGFHDYCWVQDCSVERAQEDGWVLVGGSPPTPSRRAWARDYNPNVVL